MITPKVKAQALAQLRRNVSIEDVAEELDVPEKLVKEWAGSIGLNDLVVMDANMHALSQVIEGKVMNEVSDDMILKFLKDAGFEIAKETFRSCNNGDPIHAKSLQLYADVLQKLYATFILKGGSARTNQPENPEGSFFDFVTKD